MEERGKKSCLHMARKLDKSSRFSEEWLPKTHAASYNLRKQNEYQECLPITNGGRKDHFSFIEFFLNESL